MTSNINGNTISASLNDVCVNVSYISISDGISISNDEHIAFSHYILFSRLL